MKRFSLLISILLIILASSLNNPSAIAGNNCQFYAKFIDKWGYKFDQKELDNICITINNITVFETEGVTFNFTQGPLEEINEAKGKKIYYSSKDLSDFFIVNNTNKVITYYFNNQSLINYNNSELLTTYISEYRKHTNDSIDFAKEDKEMTPGNKIDISQFSIEIFGYAITTFLIISVIYKIFRQILRDPLNKHNYINIFHQYVYSFYKALELIKPFVFVLIILSTLSLIRIAILISYKDKNGIDIKYIGDLISQLNDNSFIMTALVKKAEADLLLAINFQMILILIGLAALPYAMRMTGVAFYKIKATKIKTSNVVNLMFALLVIVLFGLLFNTSSFSPILIGILFIIEILIYKIIYSEKVEYLKLKYIHRIYIFSAILILTELILLFKFHVDSKPIQKKVNIFDYDDKIVYTPQYVSLGPSRDIYFEQKNNIHKGTPIFANNFLIYHPNQKNIIHKQTKDYQYNPSENQIIVHKENTNDTLKEIQKNKNLWDLYDMNKNTNVIYANTTKQVWNYELVIEHECATIEDPSTVALEIISTKEDRTTEKLLNLMGCSDKDLGSIQTYKVKPNTQFINESLYIVSNQYNSVKFAEIPILNDVNFNFFLPDILDKAIILNDTQSSDITVYSMDLKLDEYIIQEDKNKPDLVYLTLTDLFSKKLITDSILFWSIPNNLILIDKLNK